MSDESQGDLDRWRSHIDMSVAALSVQLATNTSLTQEVKRELGAVKEEVQTLVAKTHPVVEAMESMRKGITIIGAVGATTAKLAKWGFRAGLLFSAVWIAGKVFFSGGSVIDAVTAFWRVLSVGQQ